jgi:hypothetical protein
MMRLSLVVTALTAISLAACADVPKAPAAPVQANQAAATTDSSTANGDTSQQTRPKRKYSTTGSRLQTESPDPSVGGPPAGGLSNSSTNAASGGPH